ncbi:hypothetical protein FaHV1S18_081 [Falconid herpesvirus 1]|uniref:Uncharacterized protein n=1 Tax=Falconid herpesvirus 1 TaxID=1510155 RepID=A0A068ERW9_9ALPH|nr:hypothetical protein FaHV1S18_005 [Falconid herpesvirus 1]YP_009046565.1 hypothetical protein FaHV1S18_081 [Falconid herpesvirus 1]AID52695.1 hypothetical protein FaHV1S18_005 [Falconid herpesvirus 1]AID52771.1 hypothetical protein FaHV1S18_081 [Falconid herpesvirus 1]
MVCVCVWCLRVYGVRVCVLGEKQTGGRADWGEKQTGGSERAGQWAGKRARRESGKGEMGSWGGNGVLGRKWGLGEEMGSGGKNRIFVGKGENGILGMGRGKKIGERRAADCVLGLGLRIACWGWGCALRAGGEKRGTGGRGQGAGGAGWRWRWRWRWFYSRGRFLTLYDLFTAVSLTPCSSNGGVVVVVAEAAGGRAGGLASGDDGVRVAAAPRSLTLRALRKQMYRTAVTAVSEITVRERC